MGVADFAPAAGGGGGGGGLTLTEGGGSGLTTTSTDGGNGGLRLTGGGGDDDGEVLTGAPSVPLALPTGLAALVGPGPRGSVGLMMNTRNERSMASAAQISSAIC